MNYREPARTGTRRRRWIVLAVLVAIGAALIGVRVFQPLTDLSISAARYFGNPHGNQGPPGAARPGGETRSGVTVADGVVPDGVTVFDDDIPAVANLDPDLLRALRRAAKAAAKDGVEFVVNSGWRSGEYQKHLLREAISKYGSESEAARWVATPDTSPHVSGNAIDIGPAAATTWLSRHGARYGLCQIYRNEPWHFEFRPDADEHGCPPRYANPTQDPRMHQ
ncbi:M15 family metallopeptidase [Nocardia sp. CDC159]|uniref:M15 family metallopeptidase n=1 Tax=Nocardia pulmonis TaxID=2951408 RepID=A0A9X2IZC6_9NOCA|nr:MULTISPECIES: M15 family metallopeptidase [Nocardia]MCM6774806.1 M15 family metallopeptidase [Nocardia pulmonis]MCM6789737.1 M15 family metallopeptidase [Nocardia sp. CDC159]